VDANNPDPHRFTVDQYHRMGESGILGDDDRVELVDGSVLEVPPAGSSHAERVGLIGDLLRRTVGDRATVRVRSPLELDGSSEPEPDICVVVPQAGHYAENHPRPTDVLLLVEMADTAVGFDNEVKGPLYASAGIIETWIVDSSAGVVVVARDPQRCGYMDNRRVGAGETVTPLMLPGAAVAVSDLL